MRYLKLFPLALFFCSCVTPESPKFVRNYTIENQSGEDVELLFYTRIGTTKMRFETILQGQNLKGQELTNRTGSYANLPADELIDLPSKSFDADSLIVVFNNQKKSIFFLDRSLESGLSFSEPISRNPLVDNNYEDVGNDEFLYKITEADFELAEDCIGDCN